jgi:hypothetical protein
MSGFRRDVDEICALLGYYVASCDKMFTDVSEQRIGPIFTGQDGTDTLSRNVSKQLPHDAA